MDFKFWGAAPGGFFENPTIFGSFGLKMKEKWRQMEEKLPGEGIVKV